jgi:hypothetical protein
MDSRFRGNDQRLIWYAPLNDTFTISSAQLRDSRKASYDQPAGPIGYDAGKKR